MTGKELWKQPRPNDAVGESKESYATPILFKGGENPKCWSSAATPSPPATRRPARKLWRCGGYNAKHADHWRTITSVVPIDGLVVTCAPKRPDHRDQGRRIG